MKTFLLIMLAEVAWLALAVSGPTWALWLGFAGCALSPAVVIAFHERGRELDQRVKYADVGRVDDVADVVEGGVN